MEMVKALYDFDASQYKKHGTFFNFSADDLFLLLSQAKKNWWLVTNSQGVPGYVPANYVEIVKISYVNVQNFVDGSLECLHVKAARSKDNFTKDDHKTLQHLLKVRLKLREHLDVKPKKANDGFSNPAYAVPVTSVTQPEPSSPQHNTYEIPPPSPFASIDSDSSSSQFNDISSAQEARTSFTQDSDRSSSEKENSEERDDATLQCNSISEDSFGSSNTCATVKEAVNIYESLTECKSKEEKESTPAGSRRGSCLKRHSFTASVDYMSLSHELVETLRNTTELSHSLSRKGVRVLLHSLYDRIPQIQDSLSGLLDALEAQPGVTEERAAETQDACRLKKIFDDLASCRGDEQQRSWQVHEDEHIISANLKSLISILTNADSAISQHVLKSHSYTPIVMLVEYYQMEVRRSLRMLLLQCFGVLCGVDHDGVIPVLVNSVLPSEIAREMLSCSDDEEKLGYLSLVLSMILSRGDRLPHHQFEQLSTTFVNYLLDTIENANSSEDVVESFVTLLLALNLQFQDHNFVMECLCERSSCRYFTERIMLLINRDADPSNVLEIALPSSRPHAVRKLFLELFSSSKTAELFYTNDIQVLIGIIIRQLVDLPPDDEVRYSFLDLCKMVLENTDYWEHKHRSEEIVGLLASIRDEENVNSTDKQIVTHMLALFDKHSS